MTIAECIKFNLVPLEDNKETNDNVPSKEDLQRDLLYKLIPSISSVQMIAEMIEAQVHGPIELGIYKQYIQDLKACALQQDEFTKQLASFLRTAK